MDGVEQTVHTVTSDDIQPIVRLPPGEAKTVAEMLSEDIVEAGQPVPAGQAADALAKLEQADNEEADLRQRMAKAPKLDSSSSRAVW